MRLDDSTDPLRQSIRAALEGLTVAVSEAKAPTTELVHEVLEHIGDATRASVALPDSLARWFGARSTVDVSAAIHGASEEVATWALPVSADDDTLPSLLLRRDAAESFRVAVGRWAIMHSLAPAELAEMPALADTLSDFDRRLSALLSRSTAESLLGERAPLLGAKGWTAGLPETEQGNVSPTTLGWDPAMASIPPSDEIVTQYIASAQLARHVEGFARQNSAFSDELAQLISEAVSDHDLVSVRARSWRSKHHVRPVSDPMTLSVLPPEQMVASTAATTESQAVTVELGQLTALSQGRLIATSSEVSLVVYAPTGALRRVEFGSAVATVTPASPATDKWTATIARPTSPVTLRIVAKDDDIFEDAVTLAGAKSP